jgi:hypothetical protein
MLARRVRQFIIHDLDMANVFHQQQKEVARAQRRIAKREVREVRRATGIGNG